MDTSYAKIVNLTSVCYGRHDKCSFSPDNPKPKIDGCAEKNCTGHAFRIEHELSFNFIPKIKHVYYYIVIILQKFVISLFFYYDICDVKYGRSITLPIFHRFYVFHCHLEINCKTLCCKNSLTYSISS